MSNIQNQHILEAAILCSSNPIPTNDLCMLFNNELTPEAVEQLLHNLGIEWQERGMELVQVSDGWRFQSKIEIREQLQRLYPEKPQKYSRATLETLAIIAWRQPVTRAEIENIRGVAVSSHIIKQLQDRDWIEVVGHKSAIGRPALLATTKQFLNDLGLSSLEELPPIDTTGADNLIEQINNIEAEDKEEANLSLQAELPIEVTYNSASQNETQDNITIDEAQDNHNV